MKALYVTAGIIFIDQVTKLLIKGITIPFLHCYYAGLQLGESISLIGNFLRLTFVENPGMAFGIEVSHRPWLVGFTFLAAAAILYYLYTIRNEKFLYRLPFAMILGGAVGNLIDRVFYGVIFGEGALFYGKVVDFIDMDFIRIHVLGYHMDRFAVYNIADASVTTGIVLMLIFHSKMLKDEKAAAAAGAQAAGNAETPGDGPDSPVNHPL